MLKIFAQHAVFAKQELLIEIVAHIERVIGDVCGRTRAWVAQCSSSRRCPLFHQVSDSFSYQIPFLKPALIFLRDYTGTGMSREGLSHCGIILCVVILSAASSHT